MTDNTVKICTFCKKDISHLKGNQIGGHVSLCKKKTIGKTLTNYEELNKLDWSKIQSFYDDDNTLGKVCCEYNLTKYQIKKAIEYGLFKKTKDPIKISKKMSKSRKTFLRDNPDKHGWKNNNRLVSVPCEHLKSKLKDRSISFIEEYTPLTDRYFSIDLAFPEEKVGIEINGNQHYNKNGTLKKYYQQRHDLLVEQGWIIFEIHYLKAYNDDLFELLCGELSKIDLSDYTNYQGKTHTPKKAYFCSCGSKLGSKKSKRCAKCHQLYSRKVERPSYKQLIEELKQSNYCQLGRKYGVSDNAIRKWVKQYQK